MYKPSIEPLYNLGLRFEKIARLHPLDIAIRFINGQTITYLALNSRANQIANYFKNLGIARQDVVAILNNKTFDDFASMLACLKIGAIYTNLDHMNPSDRLLKILNICRPKLILFNRENLSPRLNEIGFKTNWIECNGDFLKEVENADFNNLSETTQIHGNMAAYIMFTSGSTGFPKGAVMTHDNVIRFIEWSMNRFDVCPQDILANVNPIYFDNSVFDFYTALFSGASLVPIPSHILKKPREVLNLVNEMRCTIWFSVPSMLIYFLNLKILDSNDFRYARQIIFGGEGFPKSKLKELVDRLSPCITFTNVYGPTECTCICSSYDLKKDDLIDCNGILPLGTINPEFDFLILDEFKKQVSPGSVGELCLLGPCVGKGYYGNTELTAKSFKQNPYSPYLPELMYCTGDLVFLDADTHLLHFVARKDNQIKHQGYRIELDEIEVALNSLGYINEAAVIHAKSDSSAGKIMAGVVLNINKTEMEIINDLRQFLPEYMIPRKIFLKETLPKNRNGKIDRIQLLRECQCS